MTDLALAKKAPRRLFAAALSAGIMSRPERRQIADSAKEVWAESARTAFRLYNVRHRNGRQSLQRLHFAVLLPNLDDAIIEHKKLRDYLLSAEHPLGRFKARFFAALGFSADHWQELESALRTQHLTQEAEPGPTVSGGQKFTIRAILTGPNGGSSVVVSVWFIRAGEVTPRFVTAYPGGER